MKIPGLFLVFKLFAFSKILWLSEDFYVLPCLLNPKTRFLKTPLLKENGSTYDLVGSEQGRKGDDGWKAVVLEMSRTVLGLR